MSKFSQQQEADTWKPSRSEVNILREKMRGLEMKVINGRKRYPFELYLEQEGIVSFGQNGEMRVRIPLQFKRASEVYDLHQYIEWEELQGIFEQFPEEKEAYDKKVGGIMAEIRGILKSVDKYKVSPAT